jgi:hypothetical protein
VVKDWAVDAGCNRSCSPSAQPATRQDMAPDSDLAAVEDSALVRAGEWAAAVVWVLAKVEVENTASRARTSE